VSREGVIKFTNEHTGGELGKSAQVAAESLIDWRDCLFREGLIGVDPDRYGGVGYGNVSARLDASSFVVSGTQTSTIARASAAHFVRIDSWDVDQNRVASRGLLEPSSETMPHAMIYELSSATECVLHVHSPKIWSNWRALKLAATPVEIDYGTPEMAEAVARLYADGDLVGGAFVMLGHEDGVVVFDRTVDAAGKRVVELQQSAEKLA
jgi:ribulose-5-phosphate 4-epimerase/fuculose-1-phosphate aldolase